MMNFLKQNQLALGGAAALIVLIWVYFTFFSSPATPTLTSNDATTPISSDLIVTLQSIKSITLDETIFADPVFSSLSDFGVTIPSQTIGRRNPFLPLGSLGTSAPASTSTLKLPPTR